MTTRAEKYAWVSNYSHGDGYLLHVSSNQLVKPFEHLNETWMGNFIAAQHLANAIRGFAKEKKLSQRAGSKAACRGRGRTVQVPSRNPNEPEGHSN